MESFRSSLNKELICPERIKDKKETQLKIFDYIEGFYNKNKNHSSLCKPSSWNNIKLSNLEIFLWKEDI
ncbi:IS3 family transposase [uncultured Cetobacterium sp.]|uniref:IS3 family transposase n=1 Tax=uncultured Cetobacterium sp. TaxID=527638 RepID=UPI0034591B7E